MNFQIPSKRTSGSVRSMPLSKSGAGPAASGILANRSMSINRLNSRSTKTNLQRNSSSNIEFKLSKKTAELTMIVQMLFTQLHTKEAECELWQKYYNELGDTLVKELTKETALSTEMKNIISDQEKAIAQANEDNGACLKEIDKLKADLAHSNERYHHYLRVYNETMNEKNSLSKQLSQVTHEAQVEKEISANLQVELTKSNNHVAATEKRERQIQAKFDFDLAGLKNETKNLTAELHQMKALADDLVILKERAEEDKRLLQSNVECLRVDYQSIKDKYEAQRSAPFSNPMADVVKEFEKEERRQRVQSARKMLKSAGVVCDLTGDDRATIEDEMAQLRKELQRYKLELKNRDASFNRMFAAAASRPNQRNGNLVTASDGEESDEQQAPKAAAPPPPSRSNKSNAPSNTEKRRIPLMPAQFSTQTANSLARRSSNPVQNVGAIVGKGQQQAALPPVQINYQ